jgi:2-polyprenyl-6-hydroxyphenyl methylase/3-demethylubiquinone-9 3-methyltransferase
MQANIDSQEIQKFSQGHWWDLHDPTYAMLHQLNPTRLQFIEDHVSLQGQRVVDLGCGGGILTEALAKAGAHASGIDLNEEALAQAKTHATEHHLSIHYQAIPIEQFAEQHPAAFDAVTCMEMLEHVPDPESIIAAASHLVKPGGWVFFSTINRSLRAYLEAIIGAEYVLKLLPKGTHDYQKFIKPSELCNAARRHALELVALNGLNYHFTNKTFSLSPTPQTNYLAAFQRK